MSTENASLRDVNKSLAAEVLQLKTDVQRLRQVINIFHSKLSMKELDKLKLDPCVYGECRP